MKEAEQSSNGLKNVKDRISSIATTLTVIGTTAIGAAAGAYKLAESASNLNEAQNVVEQTFQGSAKSVEKWATTMATAAGISETDATKMVGTMGAMLQSSGETQQAAQNMGENIVQLSGDMASFYNISSNDAFEKIRAGIAGETKPLKDLGINMSEANLQAFALSEGIKKSYGSMSQAEQTTLRYNYLMSVTKNASGDFARTLGSSFANQVRVAQLNVKNLTETLGSALLPAFNNAFKTINANMPKIESTIKSVINTTISLINKCKPIVASIGTDIVKIVQQIIPIKTSTQSLGSTISGLVTGALSVLKSLLDWMANHMGIVKNGVVGLVTAFATFKTISSVVNIINNVKKSIDNLKDAVRNAKDAFNMVKGVASGFVGTLSKVGGGALDAAKGLGELIINLGKSAAQFAVAAAKATAQVIALAAHKAATLASAAAEKIVTAAQWLWNAAMDANPIGIVITAIGGLVTALIILYNKNAAFRDGVNKIWDSIKGAVLGVINNIKNAFANLNPMQWGKDLIDGIANGIEAGSAHIKSAVGHVAKIIHSNLHFSKPDEGVLKDADQWSPDFIKTIVDGINNNISKVRSASANVAKALQSAVVPNLTYGNLGINRQLMLAGGYSSTFKPVFQGGDITLEINGNADRTTVQELNQFKDEIAQKIADATQQGFSSGMNRMIQSAQQYRSIKRVV